MEKLADNGVNRTQLVMLGSPTYQMKDLNLYMLLIYLD